MIQLQVYRELEKVAQRYRRLWFRKGLTLAWIGATLIACLLLALARATSFDPLPGVAALIVLGLVALLGNFWLSRRLASNHRLIARRIENRFPDLGARLLAAMEQQPDQPDGRFGYLQTTLIRETLLHARQTKWRNAVSDRGIFAAGLASGVSFLGYLGVLLALFFHAPRTVGPDYAADDDSGLGRHIARRVTVEPGDAEIERGTDLLVVARFAGDAPGQASLVFDGPGDPQSTGDAPRKRRLSMSKSLDDPLFAGRLTRVKEDLGYHVEFEEERSESYRVTVFDFPALVRADLKLSYPDYTTLEDETVIDTRQISAVEGTHLRILCYLNKSVSSATLAEKASSREESAEAKDRSIPFTRATGAPMAESPSAYLYEAEWTLEQSGRFHLELVDADGRRNKEAPEFVFNVSVNRRPDLRFAFPGNDRQVSPLEELALGASVWDDFGVIRYGLLYKLADQPEKSITLGESTARAEKRAVTHLLDFEALGAHPDELLSYHLWAEDLGPDGKTRRTRSEMFFAEVRHFETILREAQPAPAMAGGGQAHQSGKVADLQKQIVNATWAILRREANADSRRKHRGDVKVVHESQAGVIEMARELGGRLKDPRSIDFLETAVKHMQLALEKLQTAIDSDSPGSLEPALTPERDAYQALLKLRAREFRVARSSPAQGQGGGRQSKEPNPLLSQLELKNSQNRYETENKATPEKKDPDRELRQVLNRLRELARRQADLNKRLKEIQSTLAAAQSAKEREAIERELKRLRDEQKEILRDTDRLRNRMVRPENQERMAGASSQLGQTRENVRRASEALEKNQVSKAAAEGTRAERELLKLRDEIRKKAASRFAEDMRQLRDTAHELDKTEADLGERIGKAEETERRSLRGSGKREGVREELESQQRKLAKLLKKAEETVRAAEEPEPLLSEKLYDALRKARHQGIDEALGLTAQLVDQGLPGEARKTEKQARSGISQLRKNIDRAAELVLGDETEALRRARAELARLEAELKSEVAKASGKAGTKPATGDPSKGSPSPSGSSSPGQASSGSSGDQASSSNQSSSGRDRSSTQLGVGGSGGWRQSADKAPFVRPLTGGDYLPWTDRLRDVEEMLDDPELRAEAARVLDRVRGVRVDYKRDFKQPDWEMVRLKIVEPLAELSERISEELLKRQSPDALVPIDRDPVPQKYSEQVRRYYERLGRGK